jgi:hypothetical protein
MYMYALSNVSCWCVAQVRKVGCKRTSKKMKQEKFSGQFLPGPGKGRTSGVLFQSSSSSSEEHHSVEEDVEEGNTADMEDVEEPEDEVVELDDAQVEYNRVNNLRNM